MHARRALLAVAVAALVAACVPVAPPPPPPPIDQTCDVHWRGYVLPSDHNYAGIGAYTGSDRYMCKSTPRKGIRAQIQHLRNYADPSSLSTNLGAPFEPRPKYDAVAFDTFVYKGQAPRWVDLEGKWAVPGTTYWDTIKNICDGMRAYWGKSALPNDLTIMGPSSLNAQQIASYVRHIGNPWKPEYGPETIAQLYIEEGNSAGVRGDVAFCQSILETGWFSWPSSPAAASTQATPNATPDSTASTTTSTVPADPNTTTTSVPGDSTTTTSTTGPTAPAPEPSLDAVFAVYFELQGATARY